MGSILLIFAIVVVAVVVAISLAGSNMEGKRNKEIRKIEEETRQFLKDLNAESKREAEEYMKREERLEAERRAKMPTPTQEKARIQQLYNSHIEKERKRQERISRPSPTRSTSGSRYDDGISSMMSSSSYDSGSSCSDSGSSGGDSGGGCD